MEAPRRAAEGRVVQDRKHQNESDDAILDFLAFQALQNAIRDDYETLCAEPSDLLVKRLDQPFDLVAGKHVVLSRSRAIALLSAVERCISRKSHWFWAQIFSIEW